ncbi:MAG: hypothetical protein ACHQ1H_06735 [Nitrososphaerales archaeon]
MNQTKDRLAEKTTLQPISHRKKRNLLRKVHGTLSEKVGPTTNVGTFLLQQSEIAAPIVVYTLIKNHREKGRGDMVIKTSILGNRSSWLSRSQCADINCTENGASVVAYDLGNGIIGEASYCASHFPKDYDFNPFRDRASADL